MNYEYKHRRFIMTVSFAAILSFALSATAQETGASWSTRNASSTTAKPATVETTDPSAMPVATASDATVTASGSSAVAPLVEGEAVKRLEDSMVLSKQLDEGDKLLNAGEVGSARQRYDFVYKQTDARGPLSALNARARRGLGVISAYQARQAAAKKDYTQARMLWEQALEYEPGNTVYQNAFDQLKRESTSLEEKYPGNTAATPELQDKVNNIQKLIFEGDSFNETGQYTRAIGRYKEVLLIDPYNDVARKRIEKTENTMYQVASIRREERKAKMMQQTEKEWATTPRPARKEKGGTEVNGATATDVSKMYDKLEKIIIPECNFTDADVADVLRYLQEQSKALDPEGKGVNFVLKGDATVGSAPAPAAATGTASATTGTTTAATDTAASSTIRSLSLNLRALSLQKILEYIPRLTTYKYKVEEYAVYFFPNTETSDVMLVKTFSVPPTFFPASVKSSSSTTGALSTAKVSIVTVDVKSELEKRGVKFVNGSSAAYLPKTAKLVVRNTLDQLNLIDQLVGKEANAVRQVEVEAKFIEFTEDKLKDFTSNFSANPAFNSNTISGTLTPSSTATTVNYNFLDTISGNAGGYTALRNSTDTTLAPDSVDKLLNLNLTRNPAYFQVSGVIAGVTANLIISALESKLGADLMSAPKVTLVSGQKTKIRVVREFRYPTEWEAPTIPATATNNSGGATTVVPSNPSNFVPRDVGVTLDVKANANADRRIDLELTPSVTEFQGFVNYGQDATTLGNATSFDSAPIITLVQGVALTPVFSLRTIETKLQVIDGQTVVMGGLIRADNKELEDKVPLLGDIPLMGRLFRSKVTQSIKRNLVIFLTARMVRPDGTPEFLTEGEKETLEVSSLPSSGDKK